jgi:xyloglucan-specific endo-beta-1,4-glucanase
MKSTLYLVALSPLALAQSLCDQYAYYAADGYEFNNNEWGEADGTGSGCLNIDSLSTSGTAFHIDWSWSGDDSQVKAYPWVGVEIDSPPLLSSISSMPTSVSWSYTGSGINADVSYDLFTASDPSHSTSSGDYELMIW